MKKFLIVLSVLLIAGVGISQRYVPNPETVFQVNEAANFTDGFLTTCPEFVLSSFNPGYYLLCVDTSRTRWDRYQLSRWSVYGLNNWNVARAWKLEGDAAYQIRFNSPRHEILSIVIFGDFLVVYLVHSSR